MNVRENAKDLITYNGLLLGLLVLIVVVLFMYPAKVAYGALACWFGLLLMGNYALLCRTDDIVKKLKAYDRRHHCMFDWHVGQLTRNHQAIQAKRQYFVGQNCSIFKVYALIVNKSDQLLKSALAYMEQYDYVTKPPFRPMDGLVGQSQDLLGKFQELCDDVYRINDAASDVDVSILDDLLSALYAMQED